MAATWKISQMEDYVVGPDGPYVDESRVIFTLHWQCTDEQTVAGQTYHARVYSSASLMPFAEDVAFTPWEDVTEEQAIGWLHDKLGEEEVTRIEESVAAQIDAKMNPTTTVGLPWMEEN